MSVLDRKLRRDLGMTRGLIAAIVSIIAVGVGCYVEMSSIHRNLTNARRVYYAQCRMADFSIELKKAPIADLGALAAMREVVEMRPRIRAFATVDLERVEEPLNGLVLSLPDRRQAIVNDIVLRRGSYFSDTRDNEVIVNDAFARRHKLSPGQWIHILLNNRRQELFIVGTAISSEFVYLVGPGAIVPDAEHFGVFYLKHSYAEDVFDFSGACNEVVGRLIPDVRQHPDDVLQRAESLLTNYGVLSTTALKFQPSNRYLSEEIEGIETFTVVMPAIFLTVAALVLNVLMVRYTEQQRTVVGTLKALGYSDLDVFLHFLKFGMMVGVSGGILGCFLGYGLAVWITGIYSQFYEFPVLENRFYLDKMLIGVGFSFGCAVIGTWHGARQVLALSPAAAMRSKPPETGRSILLERIEIVWKNLSFGWRMAIRNIIRHRFRTLAGMFAASMGACILMTGFMLNDAMVRLVQFQFRQIQLSDVDLTFKDERGRAALLEARALPHVDHAEPMLDVPCTFVHGPYRRRGTITGLVDGARLTVPRDGAGRRIKLPEVGLVITAKFAEVMHLARGDRLVVEPIRGSREPLVAPVAEIADSYLGLAVYADFNYLNRLIHEEYATSGVQLAVNVPARERGPLYRQLKQLPALQSVSEREDSIRNIEDTVIKTQRIFIGMLVIFAGVIFFGSILNSSLIGLAERTREVATLRVMGYTEGQVGGLFLRESLVLNTIGALLGVPLGHGLTLLLAESYNTELFRMPVHPSPPLWLLTMLLSIVFALAAHLIVQRTINRLNWREALNVRE